MSVEAVQERLICETEVAVTVKAPGAVGGIVSGVGPTFEAGAVRELQPVSAMTRHRAKKNAKGKSGRI